MIVSHLKNWLVGFLLIFLAVGCSKSSSSDVPQKTQALEAMPEKMNTFVTVHWSGTTRIAMDPNSSSLKIIGKMPESLKLMEQTFEKLSAAPWVLRDISVDTNASSLL